MGEVLEENGRGMRISGKVFICESFFQSGAALGHKFSGS